MDETPPRTGQSGAASPSEEKDVLAAFEKAVKTVRMYLPHNTQSVLFTKRAHRMLQEYLDLHGELHLTVGRFELYHLGEVVYQNKERSTSLAYALYRDGIRELTLRPGIEPQEFSDLVEGFNRDFTIESLDSDLVTYFWERNFRHLDYRAIDDLADDYLPADIAQAGNREKAFLGREGWDELRLPDVRRIIGQGQGGIPLKTAHLRPEMLVLDGKGTRRIQDMIREDQKGNQQQSLLEVILHIIRQEKNTETLEELLGTLRRIMEWNLARGGWDFACIIGEEVAALARREGKSPSPGLILAKEFVRNLASEEFVEEVVGKALIANPDTDPDLVVRFISLLPVAAVRHLLNLFDRIQVMKVRKTLCRGLAVLVENDAKAIFDGLEDDRWFVVRNMVYVLGMLKQSSPTLFLKKVMRHADARVRKEAVRVAIESNDPDGAEVIARALEDPEDKVRLFALKNIPRRQGDVFRPILSRMAFGEEGRKRSADERRLTYVALARLAEEEELSLLENVLKRSSFLRADLAAEQRWIVEALALSGQQGAIRLLERQESAGQRNVRQLCREALRRGAPPQSSPPEPEED
jgi:hypothetical protein